MNVAEAHIDQRLQFLGDGRDRLEELIGLAYRHLKHIIDALALIMHGQRVLFVPLAPALVADHIHGRQEVHLYDLDSGSLAGLTAASGHVEREPTGLESANLSVRSVGEQIPDIVEHAGECRWVGSRRTPDRTLVDLYQFVDVLDTFDRIVGQRTHLCPVELVLENRHQSLVDEG